MNKFFNRIACGVVVVLMVVAVAACNNKDGGSASGGRIQYDPESDFEARPIDGGKGVEITRYLGSKWEVNIPPQIQGIPVTHIGGSTYNYLGSFAEKNLLSVTIPNSVTEIGEYAFAENQLTSVTIGNKVTIIEEGAFYDNQLTSVTIPKSVTTIRAYAFAENQLTSITIGANVTFEWASFDNVFEGIYANNGRVAGTYTRSNTDGYIINWTWTRQ
jgi:hypothetical protein